MLRQLLRFMGLSIFVLPLLLVACASDPAIAPVDNTQASSTVTSASETPTPTPTPEPHYKVGEQVTVGTTWVITITNVSVSSGDSSYTPAEGKQLLLFAITEKNQSNQSASVKGAADWDLRDSNGNGYKVVKTAYGEMPVDNVAVGENATGELVYEVPDDVHTFVLTFGSTSGGGGLKIWDISL